VDAGLAAELGLHRLDLMQLDFSPQSPQPSHTRSLITVTSSRLLGLAAAAGAAQLGGALLVVDQHGGAFVAASARCASSRRSRCQTSVPPAAHAVARQARRW
jgi:hypothetical protein